MVYLPNHSNIPYVGIIQIRLWVTTAQADSQHTLVAPLFKFHFNNNQYDMQSQEKVSFLSPVSRAELLHKSVEEGDNIPGLASSQGLIEFIAGIPFQLEIGQGILQNIRSIAKVGNIAHQIHEAAEKEMVYGRISGPAIFSQSRSPLTQCIIDQLS